MINKETKYYYIDNGKKGPFTIDELANEPITSDTLIWYEDLDDWKELIQIPEVNDYIKLKRKNIVNIEKTESSNNENPVNKDANHPKSGGARKTKLVLFGILLTLLVIGGNYYYRHPNLFSSVGVSSSSEINQIKNQYVEYAELMSNEKYNEAMNYLYTDHYTRKDLNSLALSMFSVLKMFGLKMSVDKESIEIADNSEIIQTDNHKFLIVSFNSVIKIESGNPFTSSMFLAGLEKNDMPGFSVIDVKKNPSGKTIINANVIECLAWIYSEKVNNWLMLPITPDYYPNEVRNAFCSKCPCNNEVKQQESNNNSDLLLLKELMESSEQIKKVTQNNSFIDSRDNKEYKTVKIGNHTWMAENLNYETNSGSWCNENKVENCNKYGRLYNWKTAKNVCPSGWHLPLESEYETLFDNVGGKGESAYKNLIKNGSSGFDILMGGSYSVESDENYFTEIGSGSHFWYYTEGDNNNGKTWNIDAGGGGEGAGASDWDVNDCNAYSVRCIKDE